MKPLRLRAVTNSAGRGAHERAISAKASTYGLQAWDRYRDPGSPSALLAAGQNEALARLQAGGCQKLRTAKITNDNFDEFIAPLRAAQLNWIESKMPKSRAEFFWTAPDVWTRIWKRDLEAAKITPDDAPKRMTIKRAQVRYVDVTVHRLPELPARALVTASASSPCGADDSVEAYKVDDSGWRRVIDTHSQGMGDVGLKLSDPMSGQRLVLTHWQSQQCTSS